MSAPSPTTSSPLVAIGGAAGGFEPLAAVLAGLPAASGLAVVVLFHADPQHPALRADLLGLEAPMTVVELRDGDPPRPGCVQIAPPGTRVVLQQGAWRVTTADAGAPAGLLDDLFGSLADALGDGAVGVILSGDGHDGAAGLRRVRERGGLTLVQRPDTAFLDGMPRAALIAGVVDDALVPAELARAVIGHVRAGSDQAERDREIVASLARVWAVLRRETGHDFERYKQATVSRRVRRRMLLRGIEPVDAYLDLLERDPVEVHQLQRDLLIGVTRFFRDGDAFAALAQHAPGLVRAARAAGRQVRVWVPGCASGEEAYSIAMLFREELTASAGAPVPVQIFATDLDDELLARARTGRYGAEIAEQLGPERLRRFFVRDGDGFQAVKALREMCIFSQHSLIRDPPFSSLDLLSCRNLLIYLDASLQRRLVPLFHYALRPGGVLFLGPAEGIAGHPELFEVVDKRHRLFRRRETVRRPVVDFPLRPRGEVRAPVAFPSPSAAARTKDRIAAAFERTVLEEYAPASAVIDAHGNVHFVAGPLARYLRLPAGALTTTNLLDSVRGGLRLELRNALAAVAATGRKHVRDDVTIELDDSIRVARLTVRPMPSIEAEVGLFLVVLQEREGHEPEPASPPPIAQEPPLLQQLESELRATRAELRATVEELEAANEELKSSNEELISTNEELQSANEELQTSKEELQSLNEELETVNSALREKLDELAGAHSDLQNLFSATSVATIFLDRELQITRFTPATTSLFGLVESDLGRPLADFAPRFVAGDFVARAEQVLHTLVPYEDEVRRIDGQAWFSLRVQPYRTVQNAIGGLVVTFVDVTHLKRVEEQLRHSEERFRLALRDSPITVATLDLDLRFTWVHNTRHGFRPETVLGHRPDELIPAADAAELIVLLEEVIRTGVGQRREISGRVGATRWDYLTSAEPLRDARGVVVGVTMAQVDIAAQKQVQRAQRRDREFLDCLIANTGSCLAVLQGNELRVTLVNPRFQAIAPARPMVGRTFAEIFPDTLARGVDARIRTVLATGERWELTGFELPAEGRPDARWRGQVVRLPLDALETPTALVVLWDVTQQQQAEEALRESEARVRLATSAARLGIHVFDPASGAIRWDARVRELWGVGPDEPVTYDLFMDGLHPDDRAPTQAAVERSLDPAGPGVYGAEYRVRNRQTGEERWVAATGHVSFRDGVPVRMVGTVQDIDDRKRAEEALRASERGLQEANARLREADRRKDEFLAVLSHELRNPLAPIRNGLYLLDRVPPTSAQAARAREIIGRQVAQLSTLVNDLLDVTRITSNKISLQLEPLDLNEVVLRAVDDNRSIFDAAGVALTCEPAPRAVAVRADRTRVAQIVSNLLQNAAKFTPRGGAARVQVAVEAGRAVLRVIDNGVGLAPETRARLFQPFVQADETLDRSRGGLGLGLALVKGLATLHGGTVEVFSDGVGHGAELVVQLPLDPAAVEADATAPSRPATIRRRILLIEDNVDAADSLREALELNGHQVDVAYDGLAGISMARERTPDVILCDIGLPGTDGFSVARALRADRALGRVRLVALTGYARPEDLRRATEAGFEHHLAKPPSVDSIESLLAAIPGPGAS